MSQTDARPSVSIKTHLFFGNRTLFHCILAAFSVSLFHHLYQDVLASILISHLEDFSDDPLSGKATDEVIT